MKNDLIEMLKEGDLRSIGRSPEVVDLVFDDPTLFPLLIECMVHEDPGVRMRSSDAAEKISRAQAGLFQPYKKFLLSEVSLQKQQEVRWHLVQILPRLELQNAEVIKAAEICFDFLEDPSKIVQANALEALGDLAQNDDEILSRTTKAVETLVQTGSPAVKNKARKVFARLVRKE